MFKNKLVVIAMAGMLAACVGLSACGGNNASSSAASDKAETSAAEATSAAVAPAPADTSAAETSAPAASAADTSAAESSEILYWEGTLEDGSTVSYLDNAIEGYAIMSVVKEDFSDGAVWAGFSTSDDNGLVTVTDAETQNTITYTIVDITPELFTIDITGYGQVELKPVTEADLKAYVEEFAAAAAEGEKYLEQLEGELENAGKELEKELENAGQELAGALAQLSAEFEKMDESTVLFWTGELADGTSITNMYDPENGEAYLSAVKADLSDGVAWYGKCIVADNGTTVTITDSETGSTITFEIVEANDDSMKLDILGYGEVELTPVTKADFVNLAEELTKSLS